VELAEGRDAPPIVDLDPARFKLLPAFEERFPAGPPSLVECERLAVRGDVGFGAGVTVRGSVKIEHDGEGRLQIEDGTVLEG
jgi:UTP--glucose-1-phosphate uridylyltransferase